MNNKKKNIILIGMPGSGKTALGCTLAEKLNKVFWDTDHYIEQREKRTIPEIFQAGEAVFRQIESQAISSLCRQDLQIIATGGGVVTKQENMILLQKAGIIFYIDRPLEMILASAEMGRRPLLAKDPKHIYTLYEQRKHLYEKYCDYRIDNSHSLNEAILAIEKILKENHL
ncbi:MAG: shikimate kinase [Sporomusaceae bacterium]|nr:shikimate kinase [Sporomusaceae bacterium]